MRSRRRQPPEVLVPRPCDHFRYFYSEYKAKRSLEATRKKNVPAGCNYHCRPFACPCCGRYHLLADRSRNFLQKIVESFSLTGPQAQA